MKNENRPLQLAAAELLALLENAERKQSLQQPAFARSGESRTRQTAAEALPAFAAGGLSASAEEARDFRSGLRDLTVAPLPSAVPAGAEGSGSVPAGRSGFVLPDVSSDTVTAPEQTGNGSRNGARTMEEIDRFFRADSRRYDKNFSQEGEI